MSYRKCIDCEDFKERNFFPHTGGYSGKCHNPSSPLYGQWTVGAYGCNYIKQGDLFSD